MRVMFFLTRGVSPTRKEALLVVAVLEDDDEEGRTLPPLPPLAPVEELRREARAASAAARPRFDIYNATHTHTHCSNTGATSRSFVRSVPCRSEDSDVSIGVLSGQAEECPAEERRRTGGGFNFLQRSNNGSITEPPTDVELETRNSFTSHRPPLSPSGDAGGTAGVVASDLGYGLGFFALQIGVFQRSRVSQPDSRLLARAAQAAFFVDDRLWRWRGAQAANHRVVECRVT